MAKEKLRVTSPIATLAIGHVWQDVVDCDHQVLAETGGATFTAYIRSTGARRLVASRSRLRMSVRDQATTRMSRPGHADYVKNMITGAADGWRGLSSRLTADAWTREHPACSSGGVGARVYLNKVGMVRRSYRRGRSSVSYRFPATTFDHQGFGPDGA